MYVLGPFSRKQSNICLAHIRAYTYIYLSIVLESWVLLNAYVEEQYFSSNKEGYLPNKNRRVSMPGILKYPDIKALIHERHRKCRPGGGGGGGGNV